MSFSGSVDSWIHDALERPPQGMSLQQWTHSEHGLSEACSLHALKGIGEALHYIHSLNVVHSNVPRPIAAKRHFATVRLCGVSPIFLAQKKVNPESIFIKTDGESVLAPRHRELWVFQSGIIFRCQSHMRQISAMLFTWSMG